MNKLYPIAGAMLVLALYTFGVYHITKSVDDAKYQKTLNIELIREQTLVTQNAMLNMRLESSIVTQNSIIDTNAQTDTQIVYKYIKVPANCVFESRAKSIINGEQ